MGAYDAGGDLLTLKSSNAGGASDTYTYDQLNRLGAVTDASGATTYSYDAVGNLQNFTYPNGVTHAYSYDTLNRLTQVGAAKNSTSISNYAYTLGAAGNRTSVAELSGRAVAYTYDSLYRLTSESVTSDPSGKDGSIVYTLDPVGNRKTLNSTLPPAGGNTYTYDADDRLGTDQYDGNGNTVLSGGVSDTYDFENHLIQKGSVEIVYDGDGNRVSETVGGVTTNYLVDTQNPTGYAQVVDELQGGSVARTYSYGLERVSESQSIAGTSTTSFYGYDGHGSVRQLTNASGAVTDAYDYDAFGNLINQTGSTPNNYLFAGEQYDPALGLYYNRAGYLNTATGRFWTMDGYEGDDESPLSLHKYLYANAGPTNFTDPSGHDSVTPLTNIVLFLATLGVRVTTAVFGIEAHTLIEQDIQANFPGTQVEVIVPGGKIDVIIPPNQLYDIKPLGGGDDVERQIDRYIEATNGSPQFPNGLVRGTIFFENYIDGPYDLTEIFYYVAYPGVIYYDAFPNPKAIGAYAVLRASIAAAQLFVEIGTEIGVAGLEESLE
jgi:RHS repeat-associated protein